MKKLLMVTSISVSLMAGTYSLKPITINKDIHCVVGDFNPPTKENKGFVSNVCFIDMGKNIVLIDAGPSYKFAKELNTLIKQEYPHKKIGTVILTNYHDDRVQGADYFKKQGAIVMGGKNINKDIDDYPEKFDRLPQLLGKKFMHDTKVIKVDKEIGDGYVIRGQMRDLTILKPTEAAEERSDTMIYSPKDSFLFAGNTVFNGRMLNYTAHSDINGWIKALKYLQKLQPKYILGGHGSRHDTDSYKPSLGYLKVLKRDITKAYNDEIDRIDAYKKIGKNPMSDIKYYNQLNRHNANNYYDQLDFE